MISILDLDRNYYPKLESKTNFDRELNLSLLYKRKIVSFNQVFGKSYCSL